MRIWNEARFSNLDKTALALPIKNYAPELFGGLEDSMQCKERLLTSIIRLLYQFVLKPLLFRLDPERVHNLFVSLGETLGRHAITRRLVSMVYGYRGPDASVTVDGITYRTPVMLAAGCGDREPSKRLRHTRIPRRGTGRVSRRDQWTPLFRAVKPTDPPHTRAVRRSIDNHRMWRRPFPRGRTGEASRGSRPRTTCHRHDF